MKKIKEDEKLSILNHSGAHLLAQAVKHLYPNALFWVGPVIDEGFYYDIDLGDIKLNDEDLVSIEKEMKKISKDGKRIIREELTRSEALEKFKNDPYKIDLINNMEDDTVISCYTQGDFTDLCRGPHVESVKEIKYFKLLKVSGAYYKGDSKNKMLQRIYGVAFYDENDLNDYLQELEEAKERDHRKIGKDQNIFMSHDLVGKGMPLWLPNGAIIRKQLENYIYEKEQKLGYLHVYTPCVGTVDLYKTSGHWDHYKEDMFPSMELDDEAYDKFEKEVMNPEPDIERVEAAKKIFEDVDKIPVDTSDLWKHELTYGKPHLLELMDEWGVDGTNYADFRSVIQEHCFNKGLYAFDDIEKSWKVHQESIKNAIKGIKKNG